MGIARYDAAFIFHLHQNEQFPWPAIDAFRKALLSNRINPLILFPNWNDPDNFIHPDQELSRFVKGFDTNRIWVPNMLSGLDVLPPFMHNQAQMMARLTEGLPLFTIHRDQYPYLNGRELKKMEEKELTGAVVPLPNFIRGGRMPTPEAATGLYFFFEQAREEVIRAQYPGLYNSNNLNFKGQLQRELGHQDQIEDTPLLRIIMEFIGQSVERLPSHTIPTEDIIRYLDGGVDDTLVSRKKGIVFPNSIMSDGSMESYAVHRENHSPFSLAVEMPISPVPRIKELMGMYGNIFGRLVAFLNSMR